MPRVSSDGRRGARLGRDFGLGHHGTGFGPVHCPCPNDDRVRNVFRWHPSNRCKTFRPHSVGLSTVHLHRVDETNIRYARHIAFRSDTNTHRPRNNQAPGAVDDDTREAVGVERPVFVFPLRVLAV